MIGLSKIASSLPTMEFCIYSSLRISSGCHFPKSNLPNSCKRYIRCHRIQLFSYHSAFFFLKIKCSHTITIITPITNPFVKTGRTIDGIDATTAVGKKDINNANIMGKPITIAASKSITTFCFCIR